MASLRPLLLSARPPSSPPLSPSPTSLPLCVNRQSLPFRRSRCSPINLPSAARSMPFHRRPRATMTLISPDSGNVLFCLMASCAALGQALEAKTDWGAKLSAPVVALLIGMVLAAAGFVPSTSASYDFISMSIMPMAVALCLLETDIQSIFTDAGPTLKAFWYGALATILGTLVSFKIVGPGLGSDGWKIASSLCASYIGGTINYVATAQALGLTSSSTLAAGMAADNVAMAAYFAVIMAIPDNGDKPLPFAQGEALSDSSRQPTVETVSTSLAAAAVACTVGKALAGFLPSSFAAFSQDVVWPLLLWLRQPSQLLLHKSTSMSTRRVPTYLPALKYLELA